MKANELRIGNLFIDKSTNTILECIGIDKKGNFSFYVIDRSKFPLPDGWKAEPIPLSEEWLLKAGFKEKMSNVYQYNGFELTTDDGLIDNGYSIINGLNPVRYIHQLQNIIFDLTGKELTFKI